MNRALARLQRPLLRRIYRPRQRALMPVLGSTSGSWVSVWRRARLARLRQAIGWRRQLLNAAQQQLSAIEEALATTEGGGDGGYDTSGEYPDTVDESGGAAEPEEGGGEPAVIPRRDAFYRVFAAMKGEDAEFTADGYPRVLEVNDRLEMLGQGRATQKEVVTYYDEWRQSARAPSAAPPTSGGSGGSSGSTTSARRQTLFRIFDQMKGEKAEFTVDGYPKVLEVNDRLEMIDEERANHKEVVTYFDEWKESSSATSSAGSSRQQALFRVFDAMRGEKSEFNVDGSPKVNEVNDRLETMGQKSSTREEIDKYFERWQKQ